MFCAVYTGSGIDFAISSMENSAPFSGTFNSNNLTVNRNSQPINSATSNLTLTTNGQAITVVYVDATRGWAFKTNTA